MCIYDIDIQAVADKMVRECLWKSGKSPGNVFFFKFVVGNLIM